MCSKTQAIMPDRVCTMPPKIKILCRRVSSWRTKHVQFTRFVLANVPHTPGGQTSWTKSLGSMNGSKFVKAWITRKQPPVILRNLESSWSLRPPILPLERLPCKDGASIKGQQSTCNGRIILKHNPKILYPFVHKLWSSLHWSLV